VAEVRLEIVINGKSQETVIIGLQSIEWVKTPKVA
jgi:hypothetical protein